MQYDTIVYDFLKELPEFAKVAEEERHFWEPEGEPPLAYVFFGDVVNPYLRKELLKHKPDKELLKRIFAFLEKMASSEDKCILELLGAGITEIFGDDPLMLKNARKYMGPKTRKSSDDMERHWGRLYNLKP